MDRTGPSRSPLPTGSVNTVKELQRLLNEERQRSDQRKTNYEAIRTELTKLQKDFLNLQTELRQVLEETKLITDKKNQELDLAKSTCEERARLITQLEEQLRTREPDLIRQQFESELRKPIKQLTLEKDQLERNVERLNYELRISNQKVEHLEKECLDSVLRTKLSFEAELNLVKKEKEELRTRLVELNQNMTPDQIRWNVLKDENAKLKSKLNQFKSSFEDAEDNCRKIELKLEQFVNESDLRQSNHNQELDAFRSQLSSRQTENNNLLITIRELNQQKDDLINEIKRMSKELNCNQREIDSIEKRFENERIKLEQFNSKSLKKVELEKELLAKDIKSLQMDKDELVERLENVQKSVVIRDKELSSQVSIIRQQELEARLAIEREKSCLETRLKELDEDRRRARDEFEQSRRQLTDCREQQLSLEKELLMVRAKLDAQMSNQDELDKLRRLHNQVHEDIRTLRTELSEQLMINKELIRTRDRIQSEFKNLKSNLDEERKELLELKNSSEKNLVRLRTSIEEERIEHRTRELDLEQQLTTKKREKDDLKNKCRQLASINEELTKKFDKSDRTGLRTGLPDCVTIEEHKQLKSKYKDLKKKQTELSSLLNCDFNPVPNIDKH